MADIADEVIQLRQIVATLQTALSAQQSDTTQLRRQLEASRHEIEQLITSQIETHITEFCQILLRKSIQILALSWLFLMARQAVI